MGLLHFQLISLMGFYFFFFDGFQSREDVDKLNLFPLFHVYRFMQRYITVWEGLQCWAELRRYQLALRNSFNLISATYHFFI